MTIVDLEKELKQNNLNGIYLLYGEETFLLENSVKKMKKIFGELIPGINYIQIYNTDIEELIPDLQTPAFGYEKKLIIVKDSEIFKKEGKKASNKLKDIKEKILSYISSNINEIINYNVLIFIEEEVEKNELYKLIEKNGNICNFEKQTPSQVISRLKAIFKAYKVEVDDITLKYLIDVCGLSMQKLINESRKLIEYAGENGTIHTKDIDLLCIKEIEAVIFSLTDELGKKDINKALETLNNLLYNKEPIQKILITLYNHFKKIYLTKLCIDEKKELVTVLGLKPNQVFLTNKYKGQANYFTKDELKNILNELINLDENSKIGLIDLDIGLKSILSRYFSK